MNDEQLLRYCRQIMLPEVDVEGQQQLLDARVLLIGLGGLGSPVAMYLAAAGVGELVLVDDDQVEISNLQRQIIHPSAALGMPKVESAAQTIQALNPEVRVQTLARRLEGEELQAEVAAASIVVDGSDNFDTRFLLNEVCVQQRTPLISAAVIRMEGQVSVFPNDGSEAPCYRCLYRDEGEENRNCTENGVLSPVAGIVGSIQATEAVKQIMGLGETLSGRLLLIDALKMDIRTLKLKRDPACPVCAAHSIKKAG